MKVKKFKRPRVRVGGSCPLRRRAQLVRGRIVAADARNGLGKKIKLILGYAMIDKRNFDEIRRVVDDSLQRTA